MKSREKRTASSAKKLLKGIAILGLLPMLLTFIFGAFFSKNYIEHIPIAVLDQDQSPISRSVIDNLEDSNGLYVATYVSSLPELEELLLTGEVYGGLMLPPDFGKDLQRSQSPTALFLIDFTNLAIGNNLMAYVSTVFNTLNAGLSINIMEAGSIIPYIAEQSVSTLTFTDRTLYDPRSAFFLYMFAILFSVFIQQPYLSVVALVFVDEKNRLKHLREEESAAGPQKHALHAIPMIREILIYFTFSFLGAWGSLAVASQFFGFPIRGSLSSILALQALFLINLTAIALLLGTFFEDTAHCAQFIVFLSIPTILISGYAWPAFMMEPLFSSFVHKIWPMIYFTTPFQYVSLKGVALSDISGYIAGGLRFAAILLPAAFLLYIGKIRLGKKTTIHQV